MPNLNPTSSRAPRFGFRISAFGFTPKIALDRSGDGPSPLLSHHWRATATSRRRSDLIFIPGDAPPGSGILSDFGPRISDFSRALIILLATLLWTGCNQKSAAPASEASLRILCGSSMAAPMQELAPKFTAEHKAPIEFDLGGSETLLPKILAGARADIFVCHDPFEDKLKAAGQWTNTVVAGYLEPVLAVRPGNPKNIHGLADLAKPGLKIGIGDPQYSTCGELFVNALRERGHYDAVMKNVALQARGHAEVANGLVVGPLDAVVVWNFVVGLYPGKLEVVPTGAAYPATRVTLLGLTSSEHPALRDTFLEWCQRTAVRETFARYGYKREKE